jgi:hypothetical protein
VRHNQRMTTPAIERQECPVHGVDFSHVQVVKRPDETVLYCGRCWAAGERVELVIVRYVREGS